MRNKIHKLKKVLIEIPLYDQWKETGNKKWAGKTCALCSLKTMLVFKNKDHSKIPIMIFVKDGLDVDGYDAGIGWKHQALVQIAKKYSVELKFQKLFFQGEDKIK